MLKLVKFGFILSLYAIVAGSVCFPSTAGNALDGFVDIQSTADLFKTLKKGVQLCKAPFTFIDIKAKDIQNLMKAYDFGAAMDRCAEHIIKNDCSGLGNHVTLLNKKQNFSIKKSQFIFFTGTDRKSLANSLLQSVFSLDEVVRVVLEKRGNHDEPVVYAKIPKVGADAIGKMIGKTSSDVHFLAVYHNGLIENEGVILTDTIRIPMTVEDYGGSKALVLNAYPVISYAKDLLALGEQDLSIQSNTESLILRCYCYVYPDSSAEESFLRSFDSKQTSIAQSFLSRAEELTQELRTFVLPEVENWVQTKGKECESFIQKLKSYHQEELQPKILDFLKEWQTIGNTYKEENLKKSLRNILASKDKKRVLDEQTATKMEEKMVREVNSIRNQIKQIISEEIIRAKTSITKDQRACIEQVLTIMNECLKTCTESEGAELLVAVRDDFEKIGQRSDYQFIEKLLDFSEELKDLGIYDTYKANVDEIGKNNDIFIEKLKFPRR